MQFLFRWILFLSAVSVVLAKPFIVGGSATSISQYPSIAALLLTTDSITYWQGCGGTIITTSSVLTAAHCIFGYTQMHWRTRVGSTYANYGGVVHRTAGLVIHPNFNVWTSDFDVGIVRTATMIIVTNTVQPAVLSGTHYSLRDDEVVWAAGWGATEFQGEPSEVLRHVKMWTINQTTCRRLYRGLRYVTSNMLCAGVLGVGGRDQCTNDSGSPLFHNNVVVGICSWGYKCGEPFYPGVNTRISQVIHWIIQNVHKKNVE